MQFRIVKGCTFCTYTCTTHDVNFFTLKNTSVRSNFSTLSCGGAVLVTCSVNSVDGSITRSINIMPISFDIGLYFRMSMDTCGQDFFFTLKVDLVRFNLIEIKSICVIITMVGANSRRANFLDQPLLRSHLHEKSQKTQACNHYFRSNLCHC